MRARLQCWGAQPSQMLAAICCGAIISFFEISAAAECTKPVRAGDLSLLVHINRQLMKEDLVNILEANLVSKPDVQASFVDLVKQTLCPFDLVSVRAGLNLTKLEDILHQSNAMSLVNWASLMNSFYQVKLHQQEPHVVFDLQKLLANAKQRISDDETLAASTKATLLPKVDSASDLVSQIGQATDANVAAVAGHSSEIEELFPEIPK